MSAIKTNGLTRLTYSAVVVAALVAVSLVAAPDSATSGAPSPGILVHRYQLVHVGHVGRLRRVDLMKRYDGSGEFEVPARV